MPMTRQITSTSSNISATFTISRKFCEMCGGHDHNTDDHVELCIHCGAPCDEGNECDECVGVYDGPSTGGWEDTPFSPPS